MRLVRYFVENQAVADLLAEFQISQGSLYHYTGKAGSAGIRGGEVWLSRADCFLDPQEIKHGLSLLETAALATLDTGDREPFQELLEALRQRLEACYVFSLSLDRNNNHLRKKYAGKHGSVLELPEDFAHVVYNGWRSVPHGNDGFRLLYYLVDLFDLFEGHVIYEESRQRELARMACGCYADLASSGAHLVDQYHYLDTLLRCIILFKSPEFEQEAEYRLALVKKFGAAEPFEDTRCRLGRRWVYTTVRLSPQAARIRAVT